jgi:hypothetical protein
MGKAKGSATQANNFSCRSEENCSCAAGKMGEGPCEESGLGPLDSGR